jgi:hypothetical protein
MRIWKLLVALVVLRPRAIWLTWSVLDGLTRKDHTPKLKTRMMKPEKRIQTTRPQGLLFLPPIAPKERMMMSKIIPSYSDMRFLLVNLKFPAYFDCSGRKGY